MFATANPGWLTDLLDRLLCGCPPFHENDLQRLSDGFIGCNLAANLAEFVAGVVDSSQGSVFGGQGSPSCAQLRDWLLHPPSADELASLVGPAGAAAMSCGPHRFDPWWQIDRWLAIDAYLRLLPTAPSSPGVLPYALAAMMQPLGDRSSAVMRAFDTWWQTTVDSLAHLWQDHFRKEPLLPRREVGALLARELGTRTCAPLCELVIAKSSEVRQRLASNPLPEPWLAELGSQVAAAWTAGESCPLTESQQQHLRALEDSLPASLAHHKAILRNAASEVGLSQSQLRVLLSALNDLLVEIPTAGSAASSWLPLIQDLFCYPVHSAVDFAAWARTLDFLDGIPSAG